MDYINSTTSSPAADYCGDAIFWDQAAAWSDLIPGFGPCLADSLAAWIPAVFVAASLAFEPASSSSSSSSWVRVEETILDRLFHVAKQSLGFVVFVCALTKLSLRLSRATSRRHLSTPPVFESPSVIVNQAAFAASVATALYATRLQRRRRSLYLANVVAIFWTLTFLGRFNALHRHLRAALDGAPPSPADGGRAVAVTAYAAMTASLIALSLNCCCGRWGLSVARSAPAAPMERASTISRWTLSWLTPILIKGFRNPLGVEDLNEVPLEYAPKTLWRQMKRRRKKEIGRREGRRGSGSWRSSWRANERSSWKVNERSSWRDIEKTTEKSSFKRREEWEMKKPKEGVASIPRYGRKRPLPTSSSSSSFSSFLLLSHWSSLASLLLLRGVYVLLELSKPLVLGWLVRSVQQRQSGEDDAARGVFFALLLCSVAVCSCLMNQNFWWHAIFLGFKAQSTAILAVFAKSLRAPAPASRAPASTSRAPASTSRAPATPSISAGASVGEIVNLMSVDAHKFVLTTPFILVGLMTPLHLGVALWLLHGELGAAAAFGGVSCMAALLPLNVYFMSRVKNLQSRNMKLKDERVKLVEEMLSGIKTLKFYAWESSFVTKISDVRDKEINLLRRQLYWLAGVAFLYAAAPIVVGVVSFSVFALTGAPLTPAKAFVSLALFNGLRFPLWILPTALVSAAQLGVAAGRIDSVVGGEEIRREDVRRDPPRGLAVRLVRASFAWRRDAHPILKDVTFDLESGRMLAVVGLVGAGKSALLRALLGEMTKIRGDVRVAPRRAFVSQNPWIQNATVKDNILFGSPMDEQRYAAIIDACALSPDLRVFPAGDETEIGEQGVTLSGGQKLRVSLARAIYADAEVYLLDDPLAAVDAHVGRHIFERVLSSSRGLLSGKTRILVTNAVQYLPDVDEVLWLKGGGIEERGSFEELRRSGRAFAAFVESVTEWKSEEEIILRVTKTGEKISCLQNGSCGKLIQDEETKKGRVELQTFLGYLVSMGWVVSMTTVAALVSMRIFETTSNFWLKSWSDEVAQELRTSWNGSEPRNVSTDGRFYQYPQSVPSSTIHRVLVYDFLGVSASLAFGAASLARAVGTSNASRRLHSRLTDRVAALPMSFYEATPLGRILNRFSADVESLDVRLPDNLFGAANAVLYVVASFVVVAVVKPWFLVVVPFVVVVFAVVQRLYIVTARQLRRLESASRSPIFSHLAETLRGVGVVRAFGAERRFEEECVKRVEGSLKASFPMWTADRWLALVLELLASGVLLFSALYSVASSDTTAGESGLAVAYAINLMPVFGHAIRLVSQLENDLVAVERLEEYSAIKTEAPWRNEGSAEIPANWPERGGIEAEGLTVRYRPELEPALKNLRLSVTGGQRVGIVGRTGAGKSSFVLALFRILEAETGDVSIDGRDASTLGLHDLRERLAVIPQDPIIFSGTIRANLDPFGARDDANLWRALAAAHLDSFVRGLPEGLDHPCVEGGENLSAGQRQLLCLARALLRDAKILVLDEATAAVDPETDALVQRAIREELAGRTVIAIAHRINTVVDYDRVIVLDGGSVVEEGEPRTLLADKGSAFHALAQDAGIRE